MARTVQIRLRVAREIADTLLKVKPRSRGKLVSAGLGAVLSDKGDSIAKLAESLHELRRIGTNLNQLTYLAHVEHKLTEAQTSELQTLLSSIKTLTG